MSQVNPRAAVLTAVLLIAGAAQAADDGCKPNGGLEFVCGLKNAEDLVALPGTAWIIASGMSAGVGISLIDSRDGSHSVLYPGQSPAAKHDSEFADCATPPDPAKLETHGLNLRAGANGHSTLYAVAHGARESIEAFDVDASGARPKLTWKGCVPMPAGLAANSVASFADGGLVATVLLMPGKTFADSIARRPTGAVYEWSPGKHGFEQLRGSELPADNGIEVSADGKEIFVVSSGLQTIVAFSHTNPVKQLGTTQPLPFTPDNVHMGPDGKLLTAGMKNDEPACGGAPGPQHDLAKLSTCPRGFIAMSIDPATMKDTLYAQGPANPTFSNATMVLPVGKQFWIGSFSADRIGHGPLR
ncbi:MAG TPA: hypothetical protein VMU03_18110 [Gammaproteobacteria bacterium]|nr:hypothetical protein [Gammaproteobacteria bacterium]